MGKQQPIIKDKQSFVIGLAAGVIVIGLAVFIGSAAKNELKVSNNDKKTTTTTKETKPGEKVEVKVDSKDHFRGNKNAAVTIVEFSDIQCPYCSRFHQTMKQVMENFPNDVKWVFKHFPLDSIHPYARKAAEATECAADQDKFWELTDKYYENQSKLSNAYIKEAAKEIGLDMDKFNKCYDSGKYAKKVDADFNYGKSLGVRGTPGSFINGISVPGALPYADLESVIREELSK